MIDRLAVDKLLYRIAIVACLSRFALVTQTENQTVRSLYYRFLQSHQILYCRKAYRYNARTSKFYSSTGHYEVAVLCSLVLQYLVPGAIIVVCYWRVSVALRRRARTKRSLTTGGSSESGTTSASRRREQQEIRRSRRTNRMLIAMVAISRRSFHY